MKTVLVTGSSGQIGSYLVEATPRGHRSVGVDIVRDRAHTNIVGDVRDPDLFMKKRFDAIIHCAAQVEVPYSMENPAIDAENNILGTVRMLELARMCGARFVYVSSAAVYGNPRKLPIAEGHPTEPQSPYGQSKLCGESYCALYSRLFGLSVAVARPFNVFSPRQRWGVVKAFQDQCGSGGRPRIYGDGSQVRDYIHAADVAKLLWRLAEGDEEGAFNACSGTGTAVGDLARLCMRGAKVRGGPEFLAKRQGDIVESIGDPSKAKRVLGFKASVAVRDYLNGEGVRT